MKKSFKDTWSEVDQSVDPQSLIEYMDELAGELSEDESYYEEMCERMCIEPGSRILEIGCGAGNDARAIAKWKDNIDCIIGIDKSSCMIKEAQQRIEGTKFPLEFLVADACNVPFADSSFDNSYSLGTFHILEYPLQVLNEMIRVVKCGGHILIDTPDSEMTAIDMNDRVVTRKILQFISDNEENGWIGRHLLNHFKSIGLLDIVITSIAWCTTEMSPFLLKSLKDSVYNTQEAGVITSLEATSWLEELNERLETDRFFWCQTFYTISARKPQY